MQLARWRMYGQTLAHHPLIAVDYLRYCLGLPARTALGGRLKAETFSDWRAARGLALTKKELSVIDLLAPEGEMFDVGAHVGTWTVPLALLRPRARIHAFEGSPSTFATLDRNIARNKLINVRAMHAAVSDQTGTLSFQIPNASIWGRIAAGGNSQGRYDSVSEKKVPAITLTDYCRKENIDQIEFLKIDVEGAEVSVLRGALPLLRQRAIRYIWMEVDYTNLQDFGSSISELSDLLDDCRYGIYRVSDQSRPVDIRTEKELNMLAKPF